MESEDRRDLEAFSNLLVDAFNIRKEIRGKVDLQKTVYFAKRLGGPVPFEFRWNILGPYSYELAHYSIHLIAEGLLQYSNSYSLNTEMAKKYKSKLRPETTKRLKDFFDKVRQICEEQGYDSVLFIECAASLDFIRSNVSKANNNKVKVYGLLEGLKPEKKGKFKGMREEAWNLLVDHDLVE